MAKYSWYQNSDCVFISIFVGQRLSEDDIKMELKDTTNHLVVQFNNDTLEFDLLHTCLSCRVSAIGATQTTIELEKKEKISWLSLTRQTDLPSADPFRYPSSSKKPINWDSIKVQEDDDNNNNIDSFFKSIYEQGDDDAKRAMSKSMHESGGTVLSTNWADVGKRRVEGHPPDSK